MLPLSSSVAKASWRSRAANALHASLPPSPLERVACPAMLLFLVAFLLLHLLVLSWSATADSMRVYANRCEELLSFGWSVARYSFLLPLLHLARTLPNLLYNTCLAPRAAGRTSPRSASTLLLHALYGLLLAAQQVGWIASLLHLLQLSWHAFWRIDSMLDALGAARQQTSLVTSGTSPPEPDLCGAGRSVHLLRWSIVSIVVTTAVCLSFLLLSGWEYVAALRKRCVRMRAKRVAGGSAPIFSRWTSGLASSLRAPASNAAATPVSRRLIDFQTDEVPSGDEEGIDGI